MYFVTITGTQHQLSWWPLSLHILWWTKDNIFHFKVMLFSFSPVSLIYICWINFPKKGSISHEDDEASTSQFHSSLYLLGYYWNNLVAETVDCWIYVSVPHSVPIFMKHGAHLQKSDWLSWSSPLNLNTNINNYFLKLCLLSYEVINMHSIVWIIICPLPIFY